MVYLWLIYFTFRKNNIMIKQKIKELAFIYNKNIPLIMNTNITLREFSRLYSLDTKNLTDDERNKIIAFSLSTLEKMEPIVKA